MVKTLDALESCARKFVLSKFELIWGHLVGVIIKAIGLELAKALALLAIAALCMLTGLVAATKAFPEWDMLTNKSSLTIAFLYVLPNVAFLAYRQMYSAPRYQNHEVSAAQWSLAWAGVVLFIMVWSVSASPSVYWGDFFYVLILTSPLFYYCVTSYRLYKSASVPDTEADKRQKSFENLIFVPAFLLCIVNFSLGLLLKRRLAQPYESIMALSSWEDAAYLVGSITVVSLYYVWRVRAVIIYVGGPLFVIGLGLLAFFALGWSSAKFISLAVMITFFLGFGEVTKHLYFLNKHDTHYSADHRGIEFYLQGANWSGVVYPTLFLLSPAFFTEMSFFPIIVVVYTFVLFWLALDPVLKKSKVALVFSFAVGYGTPVAFILSIAGFARFSAPPITDQSSFQTLLALIALVGFMAGLLRLSKDLFGLRLDAFVRNIWNPRLYSFDAACLFLLLAMSQLVCIVLTFAWFVLFIFPEGSAEATRSHFSSRLALVGIAVVVLSVLAVLTTIFRPTKLAMTVMETEKINEMKSTTQETATAQMVISRIQNCLLSTKLLFQSGRLGVSWIAGFAALLIVFRSAFGDWQNSLAAFVAMTFVTMSGFVMNDIYDLEKDRIAGKSRPIALGLLSRASAWRGVVAFLVIALGSAHFGFGSSSALWIAVIATALFAYSPVSKRWPVVKGLYTAMLAMTPFLFAHDAVGFTLPTIILGLLLSYIVFRETLLDALDLKGDVAAGIHTIAHFLGNRAALAVGWVGMFATLVLAFFALESFESKVALAVGLAFQAGSAVLFYFRVPYSVGITRITMLSGVLAVSLS